MVPRIVALMEGGAFELSFAVQPEDIDSLGHVNNVVYLRWVQDIAVAHWRQLAPANEQDRLLWIVLRHEIDYKKAALPQDEIITRTWVGTASRLAFERHTEVLRKKDRVLLAKARTLWCPIDAVRRKPVNVSEEVRKLFSAA